MSQADTITHVHRAAKFRVCIKYDGTRYEVFQVIFHLSKSTNKFQIFVVFPQFISSKGLVSKVAFPANKKKANKLSLVPTGKTTNYLVKYSHAENGYAHFSQDKKVYGNMIYNQSNPLTDTTDHLFTIQIQGLSGFSSTIFSKRKDAKITDLDFELKDNQKAIKFTGWWYNVKNIRVNQKNGGPLAQMKMNDGTYKMGFLISLPTRSKYEQYFLFLTGELIPLLSKKKQSLLTFIGGFDKKKIANDLSKDMNFLSFIYPASDYNKLLKKINTIDFMPA
jgi:hypothetical protein